MGVYVINPYRFGISNLYSATFDAVDEYITIGDNNAFSFGNGGTDSPFSFTCWVKPDVADGNQHMLMSKYNSSSNVAEYWLFLFNGGLRFHLFGSGSAFNRLGRNTNSSIMSAGTWYFVAATYSGSKATSGIKIYLDGVQVDTTDSTAGSYSGMSNTAVPLIFGSVDVTGGGFLFDGMQFHQALWNKELSSAEVNEIKNLNGNDLRVASCGANLVEGWNFPAGSLSYPTLNGYNTGYNGTMVNMESGDITTTVPT